MITSFLLLWILSMPAVGYRLLIWSQPVPALNLKAAVAAEAVVVLGGGAYAYATEYDRAPAPRPVALERVVYAAYCAHRLHLPVLVTGSEFEVAGMTDALQRHFEIQPRWVDGAAHDTYDNARNSARLLQPAHIHSIVLVTSASHMPRAVREFQDAGFAVTAAPTGNEPAHSSVLTGLPIGLLPSVDGLLQSETALREFIGRAARPFVQAIHRG
jgi:uncharacterized SAM-binding protein YcdF (DUF218 family)